MEEYLTQGAGTASTADSDFACQPNIEAEPLPAAKTSAGKRPEDLSSGSGVPLGASAEQFTTVSPNLHFVYRFGKRAFDIVFSLLGLIVLLPVYLITALAILIDDPGPVLFIQERDGLNNIPFKMWKFRSMQKEAPILRAAMEERNEMDGPTFKIKEDPRVTKVGRFIRRSSIDELPQFVNILRGEMSFVGPRPLATYETAKLTEEQKQRHLMKPGLVCYWQVSGRNNVPFEKWMKMDLRYIEEACFLTDIKILLRAIPAVLSGEGAS